MNTNRYILIVGLGASLSLSACDSREDEPRLNTTPSETQTAPDDSVWDTSEHSESAKTPMDQSQSAEAVRITADIRKAIRDDDDMSTNAANCKIITNDAGLVTLRGPVNSQAEKNSIEAKAKAVRGVARVDNQLEVRAR